MLCESKKQNVGRDCVEMGMVRCWWVLDRRQRQLSFLLSVTEWPLGMTSRQRHAPTSHFGFDLMSWCAKHLSVWSQPWSCAWLISEAVTHHVTSHENLLRDSPVCELPDVNPLVSTHVKPYKSPREKRWWIIMFRWSEKHMNWTCQLYN